MFDGRNGSTKLSIIKISPISLAASTAMAMAGAARRLMVIGKVVEKLAPKVSLVEVQRNEMESTYLKMYFARYQEYRVDDGPHSTKVGDYVVVRSKINPERLDLTHEVTEVVHRAGLLRDLVTGKRLVVDLHTVEFLEDVQHLNSLLPDYVDHPNLKYSDDDTKTGLPQSTRDRTGDPLIWPKPYS